MAYWLTDAEGGAYNAEPIDDLDDARQSARELAWANAHRRRWWRRTRRGVVLVRTGTGRVLFTAVAYRKPWQ